MSSSVRGAGGAAAKELVNSSGKKIADLESRGSGKVSVIGGLGTTSPDKVLVGNVYSDESGVRRVGTLKLNKFKPYPITGISVEVGDKTISLKWTDPTDEIVQGINLNEWVATELIMNESHIPTNRTDGVLKYISTTRNAHKSTAYQITGLINDKTYYFALFPKSKDGIYNEDASQTGSGIPTGKWAVIPPLSEMTPEMLDELGKDGYKNGNQWMVDVGNVSKTALTIGDTMNIKLTTGETITMILADLQHDDLVAGGKAPFTFIMKDSLNTKRKMNSTHTNSGGWEKSNLRSFLNGTCIGQFPTEWKSVIKQIYKKNYYSSNTISKTKDYLWIPAEIEAFGTDTYSAGTGEGTKYPIFTNNTSRIKKVNGASDLWWLRSPHASAISYFCCVSESGAPYNGSADVTLGISFGFCI